MKTYPEIERLKQYFRDYSIRVKRFSTEEAEDSFWIRLTINTEAWKIFIDDEYDDFDEHNQLLCFYLVLCALEAYKDSSDFLNWANEENINTSDPKWLEYYRSLETILKEVEALIGPLETHVSYYDYSMRTGLGLALRNFKG